MARVTEGGCSCGAIRYRVEGNTSNSMVCHCQTCRRVAAPPSCGTPLTYEHQDFAATIDVTTCSLDEPGAFPPTHHSWLSHSMWGRGSDGLPAFPQSKT